MGGNARFGRGPRGFTGPQGPAGSGSSSSGWVRAGTFTHEDFQTAATFLEIALYLLPTRAVLQGILVTPVTQFDGVGFTSYTVECGISTNPTELTEPLAVLDINPTSQAAQLVPLFFQDNHVGPTNLFITARCVGGDLSASTAGEFTVDLLFTITP